MKQMIIMNKFRSWGKWIDGALDKNFEQLHSVVSARYRYYGSSGGYLEGGYVGNARVIL